MSGSGTPHHPHRVEDLCAAGRELYERALREGHVSAADATDAPCLIDCGLLHPALQDPGRLEPVAPAAALHRYLRASRARIAEERQREGRLLELLEPLLTAGRHADPSPDTTHLRLLKGTVRINDAINEAMRDAVGELLCVQPNAHFHDERGQVAAVRAMPRDQAFLDRGGRIRTLYQHTHRHAPITLARYEELRGRAEARTLDELPARQIIIDRTVSFVAADSDGITALEIRHPALIAHLATTFDRLWHLATPMYPQAVRTPSLNGITPRQRAIAALLVEGHTDAVVADRLGMNVRTARLHIAKLAATLGSESRAQLGYLIGRSGVLDPER
ncbi:helix-turn-helix transcriptional regulator [Streptomyces sp. SID161]|uniref:helix-turn-helix domain-containing protein n=1 Tax=Streptomyces sp. SID161 TaxID=2690251 RepID=UPI00136C453C|nr:helix-turn-helix transcriptional regulator [Streptomyces sp. SID161]MYW42831.1 helix-turn-helix transcriptional regulator [Streptomyces sp. SID161]